ncbi:hypothetical protein [Paenibacillus sp. 1P07SE]
MKRRMLMSALGMGAAYLLRNKQARQKLMDTFQSITGKSRRRVK